MTSEEPGISVSAPATRPPVQDSAVAIVSLRIRQRSSSERERARASLPLMLFAPGQADGGACRGGNAFLAAVNPSRSLVVAFTAIREMLRPVISAIRARMISRNG